MPSPAGDDPEHARNDPEHARNDPGHARNDPGASAPRTRLAWRRTGLSAAVVALLAVRPAFTPGGGPAAWLAAAGVMICWAALAGLALRRARGLRDRVPAAVPRVIRAYALIILALAGLAGWVVML
jgi:hypothetical protein